VCNKRSYEFGLCNFFRALRLH